MPNPDVYTLDSEILQRKRKIIVWTPPEYEADQSAYFPVMYLHDGQLVLTYRDKDLPFGSWGLDEWLTKLSAQGAIRPAIVVAISNSPLRLKEYFPFTPESERYERFIVEQLIPWVGDHYRVLDGPENRVVMGSSMGGLVSFALAARRPGTFGMAGCMSPWFEAENCRYIHDVLRPMREKPPIRVYMDSGIMDWRRLDDGYRAVLQARIELLRLGFQEGVDLDWMVDTWFATDADLEGSPVKPEKLDAAKWNQHTDFQWRRRLERPLRFLLGVD